MYRTAWPRANERESLRKRKHGIDEGGQARICMPQFISLLGFIRVLQGYTYQFGGSGKE